MPKTGLEEMPRTDCMNTSLSPRVSALGPHVHLLFRGAGIYQHRGKTVEVKAEVAGMQNRL